MQADDGSVITGPEEVVELFNNYFVGIGEKLAAMIRPSCMSHALQ